MSDRPLSNGSAGAKRREKRIVRFGPYEFRPGTQELLKHGIRTKVQAKPLQILSALVERPGELVTREELCRELWPDGTFVDFESGLNTATNRLRAALNDSAEHPLYIETLPRLGYRFICPVSYASESENQPESAAPIQVQIEAGGHSEPQKPAVPATVLPGKRRYRTLLWIAAPVAAVVLLVIGLTAKLGKQTVFRPVTYREQMIYSARFLVGSKAAAFTTYTVSQGFRTYLTNLDPGETQPTVISDGQLASVSRSGDMLLELKKADSKLNDLLRIRSDGERSDLGTNESEELELLPGGTSLARSRSTESECVIEFPAGHVAYRFPGWATDLRVSPDGQSIAFLEHPVRDDDSGHVRLLYKNGRTRVLTPDWNSAGGLAWAPSGNEIWFTASKESAVRSLFAVSLAGILRRVTASPTSLRLFDISPNWLVLLSVDDMRNAMVAEFPDASSEKDVTEFDLPNVEAISSDGQRLLFTESGDAGGQHYSTLLFDNKLHRSRMIARGRGMALSPDEHLALAIDPRDTTGLTVVDLQGSGSRRISSRGIHYQWARFLSNNMLLAGGSSNGGPLMLFRQSVRGEEAVAMKQYPYVDRPVVSPDGSKAAGLSDGDLILIDFCEKSTRHLPLKEPMLPVAWSGDGGTLFLAGVTGASPAIYKYDFAKSSVARWKPLRTPRSVSAGYVGAVVAAPGVGAYAYSLHQDLSRLYVVDGLS